MLTLTDLFAGAGGSSTGAQQVPGISVRIAANHWQLVCDIHALNHPKTDHAVVDLHQERPSFFPRTEMLWASPECTKWSQATARIDRGLDYKCEDHGDYVLMLGGEEISYDGFDVEQFADEVWQERDGCGLYFCENHRERTKEHFAVQPKPDSLEWGAHILADDSWAPWREQNATRVSVMRARALHTVEAVR